MYDFRDTIIVLLGAIFLELMAIGLIIAVCH